MYRYFHCFASNEWNRYGNEVDICRDSVATHWLDVRLQRKMISSEPWFQLSTEPCCDPAVCAFHYGSGSCIHTESNIKVDLRYIVEESARVYYSAYNLLIKIPSLHFLVNSLSLCKQLSEKQNRK